MSGELVLAAEEGNTAAADELCTAVETLRCGAAGRVGRKALQTLLRAASSDNPLAVVECGAAPVLLEVMLTTAGGDGGGGADGGADGDDLEAGAVIARAARSGGVSSGDVELCTAAAEVLTVLLTTGAPEVRLRVCEAADATPLLLSLLTSPVGGCRRVAAQLAACCCYLSDDCERRDELLRHDVVRLLARFFSLPDAPPGSHHDAGAALQAICERRPPPPPGLVHRALPPLLPLLHPTTAWPRRRRRRSLAPPRAVVAAAAALLTGPEAAYERARAAAEAGLLPALVPLLDPAVGGAAGGSEAALAAAEALAVSGGPLLCAALMEAGAVPALCDAATHGGDAPRLAALLDTIGGCAHLGDPVAARQLQARVAEALAAVLRAGLRRRSLLSRLLLLAECPERARSLGAVRLAGMLAAAGPDRREALLEGGVVAALSDWVADARLLRRDPDLAAESLGAFCGLRSSAPAEPLAAVRAAARPLARLCAPAAGAAARRAALATLRDALWCHTPERVRAVTDAEAVPPLLLAMRRGTRGDGEEGRCAKAALLYLTAGAAPAEVEALLAAGLVPAACAARELALPGWTAVDFFTLLADASRGAPHMALFRERVVPQLRAVLAARRRCWLRPWAGLGWAAEREARGAADAAYDLAALSTAHREMLLRGGVLPALVEICGVWGLSRRTRRAARRAADCVCCGPAQRVQHRGDQPPLSREAVRAALPGLAALERRRYGAVAREARACMRKLPAAVAAGSGGAVGSGGANTGGNGSGTAGHLLF